MKVWGITRDDAERIASYMGLRLERPKQVSGKCISFGIRRAFTDLRYAKRDPRRRRKDGEYGVCGGAVCWHAHRDFLRNVFACNPDARVKTVLADYRGYADFKAKFDATGDVNIGSQYWPLAARDACLCEE